MKCPKCNVEIIKGNGFCSKCGCYIGGIVQDSIDPINGYNQDSIDPIEGYYQTPIDPVSIKKKPMKKILPVVLSIVLMIAMGVGIIGFENAELRNSDAKIIDISSSQYLTLLLKSDGTVEAIYEIGNGQLGVDVSKWNDIVDIYAIKFDAYGITSDGTVVYSGFDGGIETLGVDSWTDIVAVFGDRIIIGVKTDGTIVYTNDSHTDVSFIELAEDTSHYREMMKWEDVVQYDVNWYKSVGLMSDGTVVAAGENNYGQCDVSEWTNIIAIAGGPHHTVGLKSDGTVIAAGSNANHKCEVEGWNDIVAICAGETITVGLKSDGTVVATGYNVDGQCNVFDWTDIVAVSTTGERTYGVKTDGRIVVAGYYSDDPVLEKWF